MINLKLTDEFDEKTKAIINFIETSENKRLFEYQKQLIFAIINEYQFILPRQNNKINTIDKISKYIIEFERRNK